MLPTIFGPEYVKTNKIPLSDITLTRCITNLSEDIENNVKTVMNDALYRI